MKKGCLKIANDIELCQKAFCMITGLLPRCLTTYKAYVEQGIEPNQVCGRKEGTLATRTEMAREWLLHYAALHDRMPNAATDGVAEVST